jgi:predicted dehydrogenase
MVKLAVVGCGTLSRGTVLPHLVHGDFAGTRGRVVAVCDVVGDRARDAAGRFGVPTWFDDVGRMLDQSDAEAVLVITPGPVHADVAMKCLKSGRHVYVQKPMALSLERARELVAEAERRRLVLVAAPGQGLWPLYREMRDLIRGGVIGPVYMAMPPMLGWGGRTVQFPTNPSHFFSLVGGPLHDHGGYGVQTLVTLFGPVKRITAMQANVTPSRVWVGPEGAKEIDTPGMDNTVVLMDFGNGVMGMMHDGWCARSPGSSILRVHGLEGAMETSVDSCNDLALLPFRAEYWARGEVRRMAVDLGMVPYCQNGHIDLGHVHVFGDILNWIACIREGARPVASGERGVHFVEILEACAAAARTGETQSLKTTVGADPEVVW